MTHLFTTETLNRKRNKQKIVYQESYDDCSFAFEFVPMDISEKFGKQAILDAYVEVDGFEKVDAVGYLDISYSNIEKFNRLFYFTSDDADPGTFTPSLRNVSYGILGDNGINPFNREFPFSDSLIKAGYANPATNYANNTKLRHDYVRYTAKAITGGHALSDIFTNEQELISGVGDLDKLFTKDLHDKINSLSASIQGDESNEGWRTCKSLITGLFDYSTETDTTTARFKRGTRFLEDLAEQSNLTLESEKNIGKGEFWVRFHPGDAIALRLTYQPENASGNPARNQNGQIGINKLYDRSYKIYLKFNQATWDEALEGARKEFQHIMNLEKQTDETIGRKPVGIAQLLLDSLKMVILTNAAINKSYDKADEFIIIHPTMTYGSIPLNTLATEASNRMTDTEVQLKLVVDSTEQIKQDLKNASTAMIRDIEEYTDLTFMNASLKCETIDTIITNLEDSVLQLGKVVSSKHRMNNVSIPLPNVYHVFSNAAQYSEINISNFIDSTRPYRNNFSEIVHQLNASVGTQLTTLSGDISKHWEDVKKEKEQVYQAYIYAAVAPGESLCREQSRLANSHANLVKVLNNQLKDDSTRMMSRVNDVSMLLTSLNNLTDKLSDVKKNVYNETGHLSINTSIKQIFTVLSTEITQIDKMEKEVLDQYSKYALDHNVSSTYAKSHAELHAKNADNIAAMWSINEEIAKASARFVSAASSQASAAAVDAKIIYDTTVDEYNMAVNALRESTEVLEQKQILSTRAKDQYTASITETARMRTAELAAATNAIEKAKDSANADKVMLDKIALYNLSVSVAEQASKEVETKKRIAQEALLHKNVLDVVVLSTDSTPASIEAASAAKIAYEAANAAAVAADAVLTTANSDKETANRVVKTATDTSNEAGRLSTLAETAYIQAKKNTENAVQQESILKVVYTDAQTVVAKSLLDVTMADNSLKSASEKKAWYSNRSNNASSISVYLTDSAVSAAVAAGYAVLSDASKKTADDAEASALESKTNASTAAYNASNNYASALLHLNLANTSLLNASIANASAERAYQSANASYVAANASSIAAQDDLEDAVLVYDTKNAVYQQSVLDLKESKTHHDSGNKILDQIEIERTTAIRELSEATEKEANASALNASSLVQLEASRVLRENASLLWDQANRVVSRTNPEVNLNNVSYKVNASYANASSAYHAALSAYNSSLLTDPTQTNFITKILDMEKQVAKSRLDQTPPTVFTSDVWEPYSVYTTVFNLYETAKETALERYTSYTTNTSLFENSLVNYAVNLESMIPAAEAAESSANASAVQEAENAHTLLIAAHAAIGTETGTTAANLADAAAQRAANLADIALERQADLFFTRKLATAARAVANKTTPYLLQPYLDLVKDSANYLKKIYPGKYNGWIDNPEYNYAKKDLEQKEEEWSTKSTASRVAVNAFNAAYAAYQQSKIAHANIPNDPDMTAKEQAYVAASKIKLRAETEMMIAGITLDLAYNKLSKIRPQMKKIDRWVLNPAYTSVYEDYSTETTKILSALNIELLKDHTIQSVHQMLSSTSIEAVEKAAVNVYRLFPFLNDSPEWRHNSVYSSALETVLSADESLLLKSIHVAIKRKNLDDAETILKEDEVAKKTAENNNIAAFLELDRIKNNTNSTAAEIATATATANAAAVAVETILQKIATDTSKLLAITIENVAAENSYYEARVVKSKAESFLSMTIPQVNVSDQWAPNPLYIEAEHHANSMKREYEIQNGLYVVKIVESFSANIQWSIAKSLRTAAIDTLNKANDAHTKAQNNTLDSSKVFDERIDILNRERIHMETAKAEMEVKSQLARTAFLYKMTMEDAKVIAYNFAENMKRLLEIAIINQEMAYSMERSAWAIKVKTQTILANATIAYNTAVGASNAVDEAERLAREASNASKIAAELAADMAKSGQATIYQVEQVSIARSKAAIAKEKSETASREADIAVAAAIRAASEVFML